MSTQPEPKFSIVKLIPITVLVTALSQLSIFLYYGNFNFSPVAYFDSYEIIIYSFKEFVLIGVATLLLLQFMQVGILPIVYYFEHHNKRVQSGLIHRRKYNYRVWKNGIIAVIGVYYATAFVCIVLTVLSYIFLPDAGVIAVPFLVIVSITFFVGANSYRFQLLIELKNRHSHSLKKYFPQIDAMLFTSVMTLFVSVIILAGSKYEYIKTENPYIGSFLITENNEKIEATSKVLFIGKSQKFYFIYNTPDSSVRVISREKITKEVIKIKPKTLFLFRF